MEEKKMFFVSDLECVLWNDLWFVWKLRQMTMKNGKYDGEIRHIIRGTISFIKKEREKDKERKKRKREKYK